MNMTLTREDKKNYSIHFGCIDLIHHMHSQYKNLQAYVKCSNEQDPMVIFFQQVIDSMKKLKVLARVDLGNFWVLQGSGPQGLRSKVAVETLRVPMGATLKGSDQMGEV